ncbi:predicted protein [Nematostella vectensis]|uniref:Uncharacterized protein n=1 Tax=Nematostella vectensis TaxID=45351 RepID=A7SK11_NEMVE|nr:predicted protein [Nematostella vectensis]|eukprot:XP_001628056.1 predicted protein [Nematostella vectensis]
MAFKKTLRIPTIVRQMPPATEVITFWSICFTLVTGYPLPGRALKSYPMSLTRSSKETCFKFTSTHGKCVRSNFTTSPILGYDLDARVKNKFFTSINSLRDANFDLTCPTLGYCLDPRARNKFLTNADSRRVVKLNLTHKFYVQLIALLMSKDTNYSLNDRIAEFHLTHKYHRKSRII